MSVAIANTHNTMGVRTLGAMAPPTMRPRSRRGGYVVLGELGASQELVNLLIAQGKDPAEIQQIIDLGATDEMLNYWATGTMNDSQIIAVLTGAYVPTESPITAPTSTPTGSAQPNFLPAGSRLTYDVTWSPVFGAVDSMQDIASKVAQVLSSKWGIVSDSVQVHPTTLSLGITSTPGFTMHVHTVRDYGTVADVKSILDGEVYNAGRSIVASTIGVDQLANPNVQVAQQQAAAIGSSGVPSPQTSAASIASDWLTVYWPYLALGAGALVLLPMLTGRRR